KRALELKPADPTAGELLLRAQEGKREESLCQAEIKAAQEALLKEDYESAEQHAKQALGLRPASPAARQLLSRAQKGKREKYEAEIKATSEERGVGKEERAGEERQE